MITPRLKRLSSDDLEPPAVPADPSHCAIRVLASIGGSSSQGADLFEFRVVTPSYLATNGLPQWGRGLLIVEHFSWGDVERAVARLLAHAQRHTWTEVAEALNKELHWEYDNYRPFAG
jgi:hypothetical protein